MVLLNIKTGEEIEAEINKVIWDDFATVASEQRFGFNWEREAEKQVYKITFEGGTEILGMISFTDIPYELRLHINLLESSNENKGRKKLIDRISGCLIAFVAERAFAKGYNGFVSLQPKTELIGHYTSKFGFSQYGVNLAIEGERSKTLIQKYLYNELR